MTDKEIIEHLKNNKYSRATKGLYSLLTAVKKHILNNSGTAEDAGDIFQDALVILYKKVHTGNFVLNSSLETWLYAVTKNLWLQELRKRKKLPVEEAPNDIADLVVNEEQSFAIATTAFNLLGNKCRQLLMLFYFQKKSFREIAASLAFSNEKVAKNQKYRCIQKAKENYLILAQTDPHE